MGAKVRNGRIDYFYTDRYEHRSVMFIATVLCCIFATPLTLLCTVSMARYWREVSKFILHAYACCSHVHVRLCVGGKFYNKQEYSK